MGGGGKGQFDVTLQRPDVTLFEGLIDMLVYLFSLFLIGVCVCVRECLLLYSCFFFFLRNVLLSLPDCLLQQKDFILFSTCDGFRSSTPSFLFPLSPPPCNVFVFQSHGSCLLKQVKTNHLNHRNTTPALNPTPGKRVIKFLTHPCMRIKCQNHHWSLIHVPIIWRSWA